ncbi:MAG: beta-lactamase hydrolase domain-containing protein, partial [Chroococcales cyanobacterium]
MFKTVTDTLAIGSDSDVQSLENLAATGYKTVIDLCPSAEGTQLNQETVKGVGLEYVSVPVSMQTLNDETLTAFKTALQTAEKPVYTRCASGLRAGVFTLLTLGQPAGWTKAEYLQQRSALDIPQKPNCP